METQGWQNMITTHSHLIAEAFRALATQQIPPIGPPRKRVKMSWNDDYNVDEIDDVCVADDDDDYDNIDSDDRYSYFRIDYVYDYNLTTMIILCVIIMTQIMSNFFLNNKKDYKLIITTITIITNYICLLTVTVRKIICQLSNATHEISFSSQELLSTKRKHWKKMKMMMLMMMVSTEGSQGVESITKIRKFALSSSVLTLNPSLPLEEAPSFFILCSF